MTTKSLSDAAASAAADAVTGLLDNGYFRIYSGTMSATADDPPPGDAVLLVELRWGAPAFNPAVDGVASGNILYQGTAVADGTATWFRWLTAGQASVMDGDISDSPGAVLTLTPTSILTGLVVGIQSVTYTARRT